MRKKIRYFGWRRLALCLSFILLLLNACEFRPQIVGPDWGDVTDVRIFSPINGSEWVVNETIEIHSLVSASNNVEGLSLIINGRFLTEDLFAHPTFTRGSITQVWTPTKTGIYTLQTILRDAKESAESNIVTITVVQATPEPLTLADTPTATAEREDTSTPSPTVTITPTEAPDEPKATADRNLNCRRGPDTLYDIIGYLYSGETAPIIGRDSSDYWYLISLDEGAKECWVSKGYVTATGDLSELDVITPPPLPPTSTVTLTKMPYESCADYPDMTTCNQDPMGFGGCSWDTGLNSCGP